MGAREDLFQSSKKREERETAAVDECQILEFMGFSANFNHSRQTLKLHAELKGIPIQVLVDSGASHNFFSCKLVSKLGLPINYFFGMHIRLGDGHRIWVHERCMEIEIKLGEFPCILTTLIFDLSNLDMVLGIDWLTNLGEVVQTRKSNQ